MSKKPTNSRKMHAGLFSPGKSGNPAGRPKGSRNKLGENFVAALAEDFDVHGAAAITAARESDPLGYVKVVAGLMPKEVRLESRRVEEFSNDELMAILTDEDESDAREALH